MADSISLLGTIGTWIAVFLALTGVVGVIGPYLVYRATRTERYRALSAVDDPAHAYISPGIRVWRDKRILRKVNVPVVDKLPISGPTKANCDGIPRSRSRTGWVNFANVLRTYGFSYTLKDVLEVDESETYLPVHRYVLLTICLVGRYGDRPDFGVALDSKARFNLPTDFRRFKDAPARNQILSGLTGVLLHPTRRDRGFLDKVYFYAHTRELTECLYLDSMLLKDIVSLYLGYLPTTGGHLLDLKVHRVYGSQSGSYKHAKVLRLVRQRESTISDDHAQIFRGLGLSVPEVHEFREVNQTREESAYLKETDNLRGKEEAPYLKVSVRLLQKTVLYQIFLAMLDVSLSPLSFINGVDSVAITSGRDEGEDEEERAPRFRQPTSSPGIDPYYDKGRRDSSVDMADLYAAMDVIVGDNDSSRTADVSVDDSRRNDGQAEPQHRPGTADRNTRTSIDDMAEPINASQLHPLPHPEAAATDPTSKPTVPSTRSSASLTDLSSSTTSRSVNYDPTDRKRIFDLVSLALDSPAFPASTIQRNELRAAMRRTTPECETFRRSNTRAMYELERLIHRVFRLREVPPRVVTLLCMTSRRLRHALIKDRFEELTLFFAENRVELKRRIPDPLNHARGNRGRPDHEHEYEEDSDSEVFKIVEDPLYIYPFAFESVFVNSGFMQLGAWQRFLASPATRDSMDMPYYDVLISLLAGAVRLALWDMGLPADPLSAVYAGLDDVVHIAASTRRMAPASQRGESLTVITRRGEPRRRDGRQSIDSQERFDAARSRDRNRSPGPGDRGVFI